jgi:hypothetical protein
VTTGHVPDFALTIDGDPIPSELRASITGIAHETGLVGADRVDIDIVNQRLRWLDHPLLALDRPVTLSLGYRDGSMERLFVGTIVGRECSFPSSGAPTLRVTCQDRMHRMQQGTHTMAYGIPIPSLANYPLPDLVVGGAVAAMNVLVPIFDPVGAALSILLGGLQVAALADKDDAQKFIRKQEGQSDFEFLSIVARENGWEMFIDHGGALGGWMLRFQSPMDHLDADVTLAYGRSLMEFSPRITSVGQVVAVSANVWVPMVKRTFTVTVGWDWDRAQLTLHIAPAGIPLGGGPSVHLVDEPVTLTTAPRFIVGTLIPKLNERLTGSGSTVGDPRIRAGTVLRLEGLGEEFGGLYRVTQATHTLDGGGYRTSFDVRKDIWFASIPRREQGAWPVAWSDPPGTSASA